MINALKQNRLIPTEQTIPFLRPRIKLAPPENFPDPTECVAFSNCILHVPSGNVLESTPFFYSYNARPFAYVADAACPTWERVVQDWFPNVDGKPAPEAALAQEIAGYLLTPCLTRQSLHDYAPKGANGGHPHLPGGQMLWIVDRITIWQCSSIACPRFVCNYRGRAPGARRRKPSKHAI